MRYLILSDLHANREALQAVSDHAAGRYDEAICCGDLVGYGADPNAVVDWVRAHCSLTVRGNHDKACTGLDDLEWFNPVAKSGRAVDAADADARERRLDPRPAEGPARRRRVSRWCTARPFDEDEYVLAADEAGQAFDYLESRLAFFGHTHVQGGFIWNHSRVETILRTAPRTDRQYDGYRPGLRLPGESRIGRPAARRRSARAAYALYDSDAGW